MVELVAVEDEQADRAVIEDEFVEDLDADEVADDIGRAVVIAANPDEFEVVAVGVSPDHFEAGEVALVEAFEIEVVEDVAIDDEGSGVA